MSNFVDYNANKQLEKSKDDFSKEVKESNQEKEDRELIRLVLGSLSMKETEEEMKLSEIMLKESRIWYNANSIARLRYLIEEL